MIDWTLTSATIDSPTPNASPTAPHSIAPPPSTRPPEAARAAVLAADNAEVLPRYTLSIDGDLELILGLGRNALGAIDRDQALTAIDTYERDAHTAPVENAADVAGRGRANLEP
ncbi:hypothetical protein GS592_26200 [Rhodococcus hoagii]|nr:hypothetical protein [Prescottella equi]